MHYLANFGYSAAQERPDSQDEAELGMAASSILQSIPPHVLKALEQQQAEANELNAESRVSCAESSRLEDFAQAHQKQLVCMKNTLLEHACNLLQCKSCMCARQNRACTHVGVHDCLLRSHPDCLCRTTSQCNYDELHAE